MSDLTFMEKSRLERLLGMSGGYVLNFSNRTFQEFVTDSVQRNIYSGKYDYASCSKANVLRRFWEIEPNHIVGQLVSDLVELAKEQGMHRDDQTLLDECRRTAERLRQGAPVEDLEIIGEEFSEKGIDLLVKSIRASIDANEPEAGLDRLHTLVTKFLRRLCEKKGIAVPKGKPLHGLLGEYIKEMMAEGAIESQMTERILKSSIANLEAFNSVRNDHSFAHDNPVLNYDESLLIFNHVMSAIRFMQSLERRQAVEKNEDARAHHDDLPF